MKEDIKWHENFKCKCWLDASVCNNKQHWNKGKCSRDCEELIDKGICDTRFIWTPSSFECECDKLSDIGQCLDYENCKCRKKLIDMLGECSQKIDENKMNHSNYRNVRNSCTICITLFVIAFLIIISISSAYVYFHWYLKRINTNTTTINPGSEAVIY